VKPILILCFVASFSSPSFSDNKFSFDYDYCFFRNDDSRIFLEFYFSFYQNQLVFLKTDKGFEADGLIKLDVTDKTTNKPVVQKDFRVPVIVADTADYNRNSKLVGQINMILDSGWYKFHIEAADFNDTTQSVTYDKDVEVNGFDNKNIVASGLQFAANIQKSTDTKSLFYKNTLEVTPNPSRLFGNNLSELYYYIEFYNLTKQNLSDEFTIATAITDLNNNILKSDEKNYKLKNDSRVEYGHVNVSDIKTGIYKFIVKLLDDRSNVKTETQNQFVLYNTDTSSIAADYSSDKDFLASEYANYPEEKLNKEFEYAVYIMADAFRKQYEKLNDVNAKRKMMFNFWKSLDPEPLTPLNEYKKTYLERIDYANKNFKADYTVGWKTDRGRIYSVYGKYDDIERHPFESSTRAYEIWKYDNVQGGIIFVFIDLTNGSGNYTLVHSTARNELSDEDWQRRLNIKR
jgi:GWxTD domain-containing protein